jgi:hypothetical protein
MARSKTRLRRCLPGLWGAFAISLVAYGLLLIGAAVTYRPIEDPGRRCLQRLARTVLPARPAKAAG